MSSPTYAPTITEEPYSELLWNEDDDDDGAILAMIDEVQQQEELLKKEEETLLNSLMDDKLLYADDDAVFIDDAVEDLVEDFLDESEDYYYDDDDEFNDDDRDVFAVSAPTVGPTLPPTRVPTTVPTIPPMPTYFPTVTADPTYFPTVVKEQVDGIPLDTEPDDDDDDAVDDDEYVPGMPDDDDNYDDDDDDDYDDDDDLDEEDYYVDDDEEDDDDEFDDDDYASNYGGTTNYAGISALDQAKQTIAEKEQAIEQQIASSSPGQLNGFKDPNTGVVVKEPASLMSQEVKYAAIGGSIAAVLMLLLGCLVYKFCCKQKTGKSVAYEEHNLKDPTINGEDDIHQDGFHDEPAASLGLGHGFTDQVPEPRGMHNVL